MNRLTTTLLLSLFSLTLISVQAQKGESFSHCEATFTNDLTAAACAAGVNAATYVTLSNDCTATPECNDFFTMDLQVGQTIDLTFCSNGGTASFDTGLSIWDATDVQLACNDDVCGLQSELSYTATATGPHKIRIGGFGGASGTYTLAIRSTGVVTACNVPTVPTLGEWGLISLGMILMIFGVVAVSQKQISLAQA